MSTHPVVLGLDDRLRDAVRLMAKRRVSHLPVLDGERLAGILSERDVLRQVRPAEVPSGATDEDRQALALPVHLLCARNVISCTPEHCTHHVAGILRREAIHAVMVVASARKGPKLVGIITMGDILRTITVMQKSSAALHERDEQTLHWTSASSVERTMTRPVVTLKPSSVLREALDCVFNHEIRHIPVVQAGRVVGILSDRDILRVLRPRRPSPKARGRARLIGDEVGDEALDRSVEDFMKKQLVTTSPSMSLFEAAQLLCKHRIDALPVTDATRTLLGIVTTSDYLALLSEAQREHCPSGRHPDSSGSGPDAA